MRKNNKKGFTLVELLVVIAIVAILATVSVVAYLSFTEKAKDSNDQVLVKQLNTVLQADESINGKPSTMHDAVNILDRHGFVVEKLTPTSTKNEFVYDVTTNRFEVWKVDEVTNGTPNANKWVVVKDEVRLNEITDQYSVYLASTFTETDAPDNKLTVQNGFDAGLITTAFDVTYNNTVANKSTVMHTNAGTLTLNGSDTDNVTHYGEASIVDVNKVGMNSYHVNGKVSQINLKYGRVAVEVKAEVNEVLVPEGVDLTKIKINISSKVTKVPTIVNGTNGNLDVKDENNNVIPNLQKPIQATYVSNIDQLDAALYSDKGSDKIDKYIILTTDIYTRTDKYPGYLASTHKFTLNGNGHRLYGFRSDKENGFSCNATLTLNHEMNATYNYPIVLKNLTIENTAPTGTSSTIAVNTHVTDLTLENVKLINKSANGKGINITNNDPIPNATNINLNILHSSIECSDSGYGIFNNRKATVNIKNSEIKGYSAIYMKETSNGSTYNLDNSTFVCVNKHNDSTSNFGTFALATGYTTINLNNCKVQNLMQGTAQQALLSLGYAKIGISDAKEIYLNVTGDETQVIGHILYDSWNINPKPYKISINGGIYSDSTVTNYITKDLKVINQNGLYKVTK